MKYYDKLAQIEHFKLHPEMLPYVGPQYERVKVLLVGESHYLGKCYEDDKAFCDDFLQNWYENGTDHFAWKSQGENPETDQEYFNTRIVVRNYLEHYRSRAHSMFRNPSVVFCDVISNMDPEIIINDSDAFSCFAFCNYFQRPEIKTGGSFDSTEQDDSKSAEIFNEIIKALDPSLVVFLSRKAYENYKNKLGQRIDDTFIKAVAHPTSSWWNKENGACKTGKEEFEDIIGDYCRNNKSSILPVLNEVLSNKFIIIKAIFDGIADHLEKNLNGATIFRRYETQLKSYIKGNKEAIDLPCIDYAFKFEDAYLSLHIEAYDNLYYGICGWDADSHKIKGKPDSKEKKAANKLKPDDTEGVSNSYCWWKYFPADNIGNRVGFMDRGDFFDSMAEKPIRDSEIMKCTRSLDEFLDSLSKCRL